MGEGERIMLVHFTLLCRDGIDAVRGCVEEMKGQMPVDGASGSSRVVRREGGREGGMDGIAKLTFIIP